MFSKKKKKAEGFLDTIKTLVWALLLAGLIRTLFFQPYWIPSGSMKDTLLIGDFLFVSKFHYGSNVPNTPFFLPFMHNKLPLTKNTPSYLDWIQLGYNRLPGFQKIKRNDIVVFNWPADTVRQFFVKETGVKKPIDKKSNYVKRCVGMPGDTLEIYNSEILINNKNSEDCDEKHKSVCAL